MAWFLRIFRGIQYLTNSYISTLARRTENLCNTSTRCDVNLYPTLPSVSRLVQASCMHTYVTDVCKIYRLCNLLQKFPIYPIRSFNFQWQFSPRHGSSSNGASSGWRAIDIFHFLAKYSPRWSSLRVRPRCKLHRIKLRGCEECSRVDHVIYVCKIIVITGIKEKRRETKRQTKGETS